MTTDPDTYDFALVGTGPASTFFLYRLLEKNKNARILVLERGERDPHAWRMKQRDKLQPGFVLSSVRYRDTFVNASPSKPWVYTPSFGGGSNCWTACTPRMLPNDFRVKTTYGVGEDWPLSYDTLEPFYGKAEEIMQVSGPSAQSVWRRSGYLGEQMGVTLRAFFLGLKDVGGSTAITANGFMFYDGEHRRNRAAALAESIRSRPLRLERGRYREVSDFRLIFEDLPSARNLPWTVRSLEGLPLGVRAGLAQHGLRHIRHRQST